MATRVFAAKGFDGCDVQEIADRLGIGKGTIYRYFEKKESLFLASVDRGMRRLSAYVGEHLTASDEIKIIEQAMRAYLAFFDHAPEVVELLILERAVFKDRRQPTYFVFREAQLEPWRAMMSRLVQQGRVRDMPVDRLLDVLNDLLYGAIFTNHFSVRKRSFEWQAQDVIDVALRGILTLDEQDRRWAEASKSKKKESVL